MSKSFFKYAALFVVVCTYTITNIIWGNVWSYQYIQPKSPKVNVEKIQKLFSKLNIYNWEITGNYNDIKDEIISFQIDNNVIPKVNDESAWYIWPKTYSALQKKYWSNFTQNYNKIFWIQVTDNTLAWTERTFVVSAYYSPLPWQKRYATWSYAWDIRLNWNWTHWASWVAVHPGFIAAPSNYSFWTKIEIEWLWVWTVEDRGWAIVRAGVRWYEYDRLDIWMWYGDEWLTKALNWWKRTVKWKIVENTVTNTIEYSWSTKQKSSDSIAINITPQSSSKDIKSMQTLFSEAELYSWNINWKYSSFKNSIIDFQIETKVIPTRTSLWHWYIWKKTIAKLEAVYPEIFLKSKRKNQPEIKENSKVENQSKKDDKVIVENKPSKDKKDTRFEVTVSNEVEKKFKLTSQQQKEVEKIHIILVDVLDKRFWNNKLKLKTQNNKLAKRVLAIANTAKKESNREKLKYLYSLLKE